MRRDGVDPEVFMLVKNQMYGELLGDVEAVDDEDSDIVKYNGEKYKYNSDIRTVLFLGVDKSETVSLENQPGKGGQADTILLLVLNDNKKTAQILEISRDTMTDIDIYDISKNSARAKVITEDEAGVKELMQYDNCVFLFMSSKDIYKFEEMLIEAKKSI